MANLQDLVKRANTYEEAAEEQEKKQKGGQPTGPYQRNILAGLGRGLMNVLGGTADYVDAESQVSGLHGPASSPYVDVSKEELNKPGVLKAIGDYAQQKQQDWKKQGTTGKTIKDAWNNGDYGYFTSGEVLEDTGESVATMLPGIAVGLATRGQSVPTTLARAAATGTLQGFSEGGNKYRELVEKGIDPETAARAARGDAYSKALLYSAGDFLTAGANRLGVGEAASKGLGSLIGKKGVEAAEKLATKYPRLDKYGRVVGGLGLGTLGEMNETATETKLDDVWENYAKTGNIDYGALAQAYNPAYQTKESLEGAIQTIAPAAILQAAGMAVGKNMGKNNTQTETNPKPATQEEQQNNIPESAEDRAMLASELQAQNAQSNARIQELQKEFPNPQDVDLDNLSQDQYDRLLEMQELQQQVAANNATLEQLGETGASVNETAAPETTTPATAEELDNRIAAIEDQIEVAAMNGNQEQVNRWSAMREQLIQEKNNILPNDIASLQTIQNKVDEDIAKLADKIKDAISSHANANDKNKGKAFGNLQKLYAQRKKLQERRKQIADKIEAVRHPDTTNVQPQNNAANIEYGDNFADRMAQAEATDTFNSGRVGEQDLANSRGRSEAADYAAQMGEEVEAPNNAWDNYQAPQRQTATARQSRLARIKNRFANPAYRGQLINILQDRYPSVPKTEIAEYVETVYAELLDDNVPTTERERAAKQVESGVIDTTAYEVYDNALPAGTRQIEGGTLALNPGEQAQLQADADALADFREQQRTQRATNEWFKMENDRDTQRRTVPGERTSGEMVA